jgi:hypothetical protein
MAGVNPAESDTTGSIWVARHDGNVPRLNQTMLGFLELARPSRASG